MNIRIAPMTVADMDGKGYVHWTNWPRGNCGGASVAASYGRGGRAESRENQLELLMQMKAPSGRTVLF